MTPAVDPATLLRAGLLEGVSLLVGRAAPAPADGGSADGFADTVGAGCAALGARVFTCVPEVEDELAMDEAVAAALADAGTLDMLVVDGAGLYAYARAYETDPAAAGHAGHLAGHAALAAGHAALAAGHAAHAAHAAGHAALRACVDATWNLTRAFVNRALLPASRGGAIVYVAPAVDAGANADAAAGVPGANADAGAGAHAARAALENLARTLSVEWARHDVTVVTIAPGLGTAAGEVAALAAYLASPAGAYFSGCRLDLGVALSSSSP
ncbi:MAG TPA: hypothetical protein VID29_06000 [Solirubrobacteraceae bacterium]